MKNVRSLIFPLYACCAVALNWSCTGLQPIAGGTSETTNGFIAAVRSQSGTPVSRALVRLRPEQYLSDTAGAGVPYNRASVVDTFTDTLGRFRITDIDTGKYAIEIQDGMGGGALIRSSALKDSIVDCGVAVVRQVGGISGFVDRAVVGESVTVYVRVYGLERQVLADPVTGGFALNGVPAEMYTLSFIASSSAYASRELSASAPSGGTADVGRVALFPFSGWRYSMPAGLNTTSAGANVPGDVYDFPVLVRLRDSNFIFSQAGITGEDIRFAKPDSTPLPFQIERWDPAAGLAEVWVKIDTVHGDNNTQSIIMYWGNPGAASASYSTAVFDTANGFKGVWHLGQPAGAVVMDATANGIHGTATATTTAAGAVGTAQLFDGTSSFIQVSGSAASPLNFPENGTYSVSAWIHADTLDTLYYGIVYKSNFQYGLQIRPERNWEFFSYIDGTGWEGSRSPASAGSWHFLTGVRQGTQQYLYVNGVCVDSSVTLKSSNLSREYDSPLEIGHCPDGGLEPDRWFDGVIDEVRISSVSSSADWIKLCYMNQKAQDALVKW